jgi:CubicO group peptidase (beta-lactamase class C family)
MGAFSRPVIGTGIFLVLIGWLAPMTRGADRVWPSPTWTKAEDPAALGWSVGKLATAEDYSRAYAPTAVMIVQDGKVIASWGDVAHKVNIRSMRKSLLSALYGIAVADKRIRLDRTIGELGIDDRAPSLSETEKQATIRDLLMARSGVYHAAAYEAPDMKARRPQRGSHSPGSYWYYNNWDFNTLGFIYQKLVGADVFHGFAERIAKPIGVEDFSAADGKFVFEQSTKPWSQGDRGLDYGYLWWVLPKGASWGQPSLAGSYMALGFGGQGLAIVPQLRLVVAQLIDVKEGQERIGGGREFAELLRLIAAAAGS